MTRRLENPAVRRLARVLALVPALLVTTVTGTAFAEAPESWEDTPKVSALEAILVIGLIPLGLFALITLLVYIPSLSRGERYQPGQAWRAEPEWFGGPRHGAEGLEPGAAGRTPAAVGAGGAGGTDDQGADRDPERGGASGRW